MKTLLQLQSAAQNFADHYKNQTDERREKDTFWNEFFAIFGIDRKNVVHFEYAVKDPSNNTQFVDVFWEGIFLAEHKSANKNLAKAKEQAERYLQEIERTKPSALPEYYAVSDFAHFHLYRHEPKEGAENQWQFPLEELPEYITRGVFDFMFGIEAKVRQIQEEANIQAATAIGRLHDALQEEGIYEEHELRLFITRLLFLFFADDSAVFQRNYLFQDFLESCKEADTLGDKLNQLFEFLNTPDQKRSKTQSEKFKGFEYVNGGLFKERLRTFDFTAKQHRALIDCGNFDWRNISPEIFGTLFQSVMDAQERREAGAHYTEAANIDKVINGLFLENLRAEFEAVKALKRDKAKKLAAFYQKIQNLQFLDPACGCGNFLIVAYDRIRALEDDIIAEALKDKAGGLFDSPSVQCRLKQFHGIEIDEFAVLIARTAMWLKTTNATSARKSASTAKSPAIRCRSKTPPKSSTPTAFGHLGRRQTTSSAIRPLSARPTKPKSRKTTSKASAAISKATACWITSATGMSKPPASWRRIPKFRRHLSPPIPSAKASRSKSSGAAF